MNESNSNIPPSSQGSEGDVASCSEVSSEPRTSISDGDGAESVKSQTCKIAKPTGLKLSTATPAPRIGRLCNSIPKPPVPPNTVTTQRTGAGGGEETMSTSYVRKISDELARKRLTDVDETDENALPYSANSYRTHDRKMSSGSVLSDSSRKSDDLWKKRSSDASLSADSPSDYWKNDFEPRRASDASVVLTEDTDQFIIGDRVWVGGVKPGQIAYIGETQFAPGEWAGVVLDEPIGKNDGTVANIRYFQCEPKKGIFSRLTRLTRYPLADGGAGEPAAPRLQEPRRTNGSIATAPKKSSLVLTPPAVSKNNLPKPPSPDSALQPKIQVGDRVIVKSSQGSKAGILRYLGTTDFAAGEWCGVELDDPLGKNDGSVSGTRYFQCQPKFGLFAPLHKVSKSPANKRFLPGNCVIHNKGGVAIPGVRRQGSKESLVSLSSTASTSASVRSTTRKIGVRTPTTPTSAKNALQETLKEKELHIEQLLKERDLERAEVTRAASQADEAERRLAALKQEFDQQKEEAEARVSDLNALVLELKSHNEELRNLLEDERRKCEDLQFRFEEERIEKSDLESASANYEEKTRMLEKTLLEERRKAEALEQESNKLFEAEEQLMIVKDELDSAKEEVGGLQTKLSSLQQEHISLEAQLMSARAEMESLRAENLTLEKYKEELGRKEAEVERLSKEVIAKEQNSAEKEKEIHGKYLKIVEELTAKHQTDSANHTNQLDQLKSLTDAKLKLLEDQLDEKIKSITTLESELHETRILLSKTTAEKSSEQDRRKEVEEKLEKALKDTAEELTEEKRRLDGEAAKCEDLLREKRALQEELTSARSSLTLVSEDAERKVADLNVTIARQEQQLEKARKECESLKKAEIRLQETEKALREKTSETEALKEALTKAKEKFEMEKRELEQLHTTREENLQSRVKSLEDTEQSREKELGRLNGDLESVKKSLSGREEELEKERLRIKQLEEKAAGLEDTLKKVREEKEMEAKCLEEKLTQMTSQKDKLECDIANFMQASDKSSVQLEKLKEFLEEKEKEKQALAEDIRNFEKTERELKQALEKREAEGKALREELERAKLDLEQQKERLKDEVSGRNNRLKELEDSWRKEVENLKKDSGERERDLKEAMRMMEAKGAEEKKIGEEQVKKMEMAQEELKKKLTEEEESKESLKKNMEELRNERDGLLRAIEDKNHQLSISEKERTEKEKKDEKENEKVGTALKEAEEKLEKTREELTKVQKEKAQSEEEKLKLEETRKALEMQKKDLKEKNVELEMNAKSVESENKFLKEAMDKLREEKTLLDKDSTQKVLLLNELRSQLEAVASSGSSRDAEKDARIGKLEQEVAELRRRLQESELTQANAASENSNVVAGLRIEMDRLKQERSEKEKDAERTNELVTELRKEVERGKTEREKREEETRQLEKEVQKAREELETEKKKNSEQVKASEKEREDLKKKLAEMKEFAEKISEVERREEEAVRRNREEKECLEKALETTRGLLNEKEKEAKSLTERVEVLKEEKAKLENSNINLSKTLEQKKMEEMKRKNGNAEEDSQEEEREFQKGQVDFLNSVIVDMQKKNDALKARIEILEMGFSPEDVDEFDLHNITTRSVAPRLFCDICDRFDLHDTEDCPTQASEDVPRPKAPKTKVPPPERPYCEICEVFGHDTADCDDGETF